MIYFKSAHIYLKLYQCDIIIFKSGETEKLTAEILVLYQLTMEGVSGLLFITSLGAACITVILPLYLQFAEEIPYSHYHR